MLHVGLTGGIGSGKSTITQIFELLNIPVYNSDLAAKKIMNENHEVRSKIIELIGKESYSGSNINRSFISEKVFNNNTLLQKLNQIVHPMVYKDYDHWAKVQNSDYVVKESALLLDTLPYQKVDQIVVVFSPLALRIKRVMTRDNLSFEETTLRISKQRPDKEFIEAADYIIVNDLQHSLISQVQNIHLELLNFAKIKS